MTGIKVAALSSGNASPDNGLAISGRTKRLPCGAQC